MNIIGAEQFHKKRFMTKSRLFNYTDVREMSGSCQGKNLVMENCVTFIIFHYSVAVDGSVIVVEYELDSLIIDFNTSSTGVV